MHFILRRKKQQKLDENEEATRKSKCKIKAAGFQTDAASVFEANLSTCRSGVAAMLDVELKRATSLSSITVDDSLTSSIGIEMSESLCDVNDELCDDELHSSTPSLYTTPYHASFHPAPSRQEPTKQRKSQTKVDATSLRPSAPNRSLDEFFRHGNTMQSRRSKATRSCVSMPSAFSLSRRSLRADAEHTLSAYEKIVSDKEVETGCLFEPTGWE